MEKKENLGDASLDALIEDAKDTTTTKKGFGSFFKKKSKKPKSSNATEKQEANNIFDDFNTDASLQEDVSKLKKQEEKDVYFYLHLAGRVLQIVFFLLFFIVAFSYAYIFVQKNENIDSQSYLDPVCNLVAGEVPPPNGSCSSIANLQNYYKNEAETQKKSQAKKIIDVLPDIYENENFLASKEVQFLLDRSENKLRVLEVLARFDNLKNDFLGIDRKKIICSDFEIQADEKILKAQCSAYIEGFSEVIGFTGSKDDKVSGTAISLANSFLNYIQKNSQDFTIIDRQKVFSVENIESEDGYTNTTNFDVQLQINF